MSEIDIFSPEGDDDGYLTDEWLDALRSHKFTPAEAKQFLLQTFPAACEMMRCCRVDVTDGKDSIDNPCKVVRFVTGGWSGAEELIGVMLDHFFIAYHHESWRRGGLYVFEVPSPLLPGRVTGSGVGPAPTIPESCEVQK
jgi:hypothetical protein